MDLGGLRSNHPLLIQLKRIARRRAVNRQAPRSAKLIPRRKPVKKIVIQIELNEGGIESYDHVLAALQATAGTLSDSSEPLSASGPQDVGVFTDGGQFVGVFTITDDPINDFTHQLS